MHREGRVLLILIILPIKLYTDSLQEIIHLIGSIHGVMVGMEEVTHYQMLMVVLLLVVLQLQDLVDLLILLLQVLAQIYIRLLMLEVLLILIKLQ